jgi:putative Ca2+/H+ antiporter (TMEM165/GDT1 family)
VDPYIALVTFPVIIIGELPDKTMFASLVMATKGRPRQLWLGAAGPSWCTR